MTIVLGLLLIISLGLLLHSPSAVLLFWTLLTLVDYFQLVNFDVLFYVTLVKGISLNIGDFLAIFYGLYFLLTKKEGFVSPRLMFLVIFLFISVAIAIAFSAFFSSMNIGIVGNSLRSYMVYFTLLGMVMLINRKDRLDLFIRLVYCFALFGIALHIYESLRGAPIIVPGGGITFKHYLQGAGTVGEVKRIWNRAVGPTLFVFAFSLASLITTRKRVLFHVFVSGMVLISVLLSYTRTLYIIIFIIVCFFLYSSMIKEKVRRKGALLYMAIVVFFAISAMTVGGGKYYEAVTSRVSTIAQSGQEAGGKNTVTSRLHQFQVFIDLLNQTEFGILTGVGFQNKAVGVKTSDLGFINLYFRIGFLGVLFMVGYFLYLRKGMLLYGEPRSARLKRHLVTLRCLIPAMFFSSVTFDYFVGTYFILLASCTVLIESGRRSMLLEQNTRKVES